jgi:hypothetical protein
MILNFPKTSRLNDGAERRKGARQLMLDFGWAGLLSGVPLVGTPTSAVRKRALDFKTVCGVTPGVDAQFAADVQFEIERAPPDPHW